MRLLLACEEIKEISVRSGHRKFYKKYFAIMFVIIKFEILLENNKLSTITSAQYNGKVY